MVVTFYEQPVHVATNREVRGVVFEVETSVVRGAGRIKLLLQVGVKTKFQFLREQAETPGWQGSSRGGSFLECT